MTRLKRSGIFLLEWIIEILKQGIQKVHFWTLREKKKNNSDLARAKEELVINSNESVEISNVDTEKTLKQSKSGKKILGEGSILEKISLQEDDVVMDSVIKSTDNKNANKKSFIKGLFNKKRLIKKRNVDIKQAKEIDAEEWSLEKTDNFKKNDIKDKLKREKRSTKNTGDDVLGVDRKILEKKILQRIDNDPVNIDNYHELGALYIKMKKYDDAMEVFGYILGVKPDDLEAKRRQDKIKLLKKAALS
jgi:tetratricopeptide (TPR) repeat protein